MAGGSGSTRSLRQATWVATANGTRWRTAWRTRTTRRAPSRRGRSRGWRSGMPRRPSQWLVLLRAALVVVGGIVVGVTDFPPSYTPWAWAVVGFFAAVTFLSGTLSAIELGPAARFRARTLLLILDALVAI